MLASNSRESVLIFAAKCIRGVAADIANMYSASSAFWGAPWQPSMSKKDELARTYLLFCFGIFENIAANQTI